MIAFIDEYRDAYALSISKRRAEEAREGLVQVQMYAQFFGGNNVPNAYSESPGTILFPTEIDAHKQLIKCLRAAHIAGLKNSTGRFQETLKHFVVPSAN